MEQGTLMKFVLPLVKQSLKQTFQKTFPLIPEKSLDLQVSTINNLVEYEYQSASVLKLFNMLKKQNVFEENLKGFKTAKDVADKIAASHDQNDPVIRKLDITEQGFINIALQDSFIENEINTILRSGLKYPLQQQQRVLVDFSSPNIAKEMHVGHLRSTIIGESLCRILEYQGNDVKRVNHIGDWGTQFGMLIAYLLWKFPNYQTEKPILSELEQLYKEAKQKFDEDAEFKKDAQSYVVKLQAYDETCINAWKMICQLSREEYEKIYKRLGVNVEEMGESFYNPFIPQVIQECEEKGIVQLSNGAKCIFTKVAPIPLMIVKSDGGYNYDTTDMAAAKYRLLQINRNRIIYITDVGQQQHFKMIIAGAEMMGWHTPPTTQMEHMGFGLVLGPDGKKFKTRSGETVKLNSLLDEAKDRALNQIKKRVEEQKEGKEFQTGSNLNPADFEQAAERMGMAAVKYYDLKQNRITDYAFNYDKMLDPKGNTAVYLMYSYVRMCSVLRKADIGNIEEVKLQNEYKINHPYERYLAASLIKFVDVVQQVTDQLALNWLCDYIYDICTKVSESYTKFRILNDEHTLTRVLLCEAVRIVLKQAFFLVGIEPVERI